MGRTSLITRAGQEKEIRKPGSVLRALLTVPCVLNTGNAEPAQSPASQSAMLQGPQSNNNVPPPPEAYQSVGSSSPHRKLI